MRKSLFAYLIMLTLLCAGFVIGGLTVFNILPGIINGFGEEFGHRGFVIVQNQFTANLAQYLVFVLIVAFLYDKKKLNVIPKFLCESNKGSEGSWVPSILNELPDRVKRC